MSTAYDEVTYPSAVYPETHPDRLAVIATLAGLQPVPIESARVLELGCGDGFNLISMAYGLPESRFMGIDLAAKPISRGAALIEKLGLTNISLHAADVTQLRGDLGQFDYIIAHGLYSWVPPEVQARIMEICRAHLSVNGIAYISYNAYPGNHARDLVRGMMRYHVAHFENPTHKIAQGRALIKLLSESAEGKEPYRQLLGLELERIRKYTDSAFFHDDLSAVNQPFYFHEFMAVAERHDLQYLGEADLTEMQERDYPPSVAAVLAELDPKDIVGGEQYRDFLRCRAFRRTLLCRKDLTVHHGLESSHMRDLYVAGDVRSKSGQSAPNSPETFFGLSKSELETSRPIVKAALRQVGRAWPDYVPFSKIVSTAREEIGRTGDDQLEADVSELSGALLQAGIAGAVEIHAHRPRFVLEPGERPLASALARLQLLESNRASSVFHRVIQLDDPLSRMLIKLLDGTRDRRSLQLALNAGISSGAVKHPGSKTEITAEELDAVLRQIARLGLIVG